MLDFSTSNGLIILFAICFAGIALFLILYAIKEAVVDHRRIKKRLEGNWQRENTGTILKQNQVFESFANHLTLPDDEEISKIRAKLARAGFYGTSSVKLYYAIRVLLLIVPQAVFILSWLMLFPQMEQARVITLSTVLIGIGMVLPPYVVRMRESRRTQQIKNGFPDMMDLTVACIEAGLGVNAAFLRVADEIGSRYPALKINLDLLNLELRAGRDRHIGMTNFANRVNLEEARSLAVMMRQSEEMGSSLGKSLRTFSDDMRNKRTMRAEEKAMALPAKMTVPLILFIFPSILAMLLVPAGIRVMGAMS